MPRRLSLIPFGSADNPLVALSRIRQGQYVKSYLEHLGASTVLRETQYFDRDYLAEFSAFYGISSRGYPNTCERLHFFGGDPVHRGQLRAAAAGRARAAQRLQDNYLGFAVVRPIPSAPFGRTALRWYPERTPATPRVTQPSREYACHVAGVTLKVRSLAWQQQDTGVGACATIALWTILHSSAFDDHHAIPTTAEITRHAHRTASLGARVFPSSGLTISQVCEAIKECCLAPVVAEGDIRIGEKPTFSRPLFTTLCASLIRSGYPILMVGERQGEQHAVCIVGFREAGASIPAPNHIELQDVKAEYVYIHDDNIGPNVRFAVSTVPSGNYVSLSESPPTYVTANTTPCSPLIPSHFVAAVHEDLRTSPAILHVRTVQAADTLLQAYGVLRNQGAINGPALGFTVSTRMIKLHEYLGNGLQQVLGHNSRRLASTRLFLTESVPPMSLHIGIGRIGWGDTPLMDLLFDTTDSDRNLPCFCHVSYEPATMEIAKRLRQSGILDLGIPVKAH